MNPKYGRALIAFACLTLAALPVMLSPLASQAQSDPTEIPSTTVAHAEPAAITDIYFAPEVRLDLEAPESLRAPAESTLLVGYDAAAEGRIDHLTTSFELLSETTLGTGQQLALDGQGNLYSGYQDGTSLRVITAVCSLENDPALPAAVDYQIVAAASVVQPRGIAVIDSLAITLVADSNPELPMIALFGKLATGETILGLRLTALNDSHPTDLTYDAANDRLFVATQEGTVLVFNEYSLDYGVEGPDQVIVPYDPSGTVQAVNSINSLAYDAATDTLVLADSGEAGNAADGQILVLNNVTLRSSAAAVRLQIKGAETHLLDPLDVAFDGSSIYVADGSSGALLRFDDVLTPSGIVALAPAAEIPAPDIRSVLLLPPVSAEQGACQTLPKVEPTPTIAGGAELLTQVPSLQPPTSVPPTAEPPANEQPPAAAPTSVPPTGVPPTSVPPTSVPATLVPPTSVPPTATSIPPTSMPPTAVPPTSIPPTATSILPLPLPTLEIPLPLPTVDLPLPLPTVDLPIIGGGNGGPGNGGPGDGHGPGNGDHGDGHGPGNGGHGDGHGHGTGGRGDDD
jgi:hypothetical protein